MIKAIINHMNTDPNAEKHVMAGQTASLIGAICVTLSALVIPYSLDTLLLTGLVVAFLGAFSVGIAIEVWQRIDRCLRGVGQNTLKESCLDALVTGAWPLWYLK